MPDGGGPVNGVDEVMEVETLGQPPGALWCLSPSFQIISKA